MKKKSVISQLFAFTNGCRGKTALSIILAVIGVLCGMAPYFALAGILTEMIQNILTVQHIFCYVGIAVLGETLKMVLSTLYRSVCFGLAHGVSVYDCDSHRLCSFDGTSERLQK